MQKETGTNEQTNTDALDLYDLFSRGEKVIETKYEMKTKRISIHKERTQI